MKICRFVTEKRDASFSDACGCKMWQFEPNNYAGKRFRVGALWGYLGCGRAVSIRTMKLMSFSLELMDIQIRLHHYWFVFKTIFGEKGPFERVSVEIRQKKRYHYFSALLPHTPIRRKRVFFRLVQVYTYKSQLIIFPELFEFGGIKWGLKFVGGAISPGIWVMNFFKRQIRL